MKKVNFIQFEKGDHVLVTGGYNKGRVGIVLSHTDLTDDVEYKIMGKDYDEDDCVDDYESSPSKFLKYLSKKEFEQYIKDQKILFVPGLPVTIQYSKNQLIIGDNVVTPANAKKLAQFILENTKGKK